MDISKQKSEIINIKDELGFGKALFAKLSPAYEIAAYIAPASSDIEAEVSEKQSSLHFVSWNQELIKPIARKLVHQSHIVFKHMKQINKNDSSFSENMIQSSKKYRSILRSCFLEANKVQNTEAANLYKMMELVWSLCEVMLVENLSEGLILIRLMEWCRWHFPIADKLVNDTTSSEDPVNHPSYWDAVYTLMLQGSTEEACNLLLLNKVVRSPFYKVYSSIEELLKKRPVYSSNIGSTVSDYEWRHKNWLEECKFRLSNGDFESVPQLATVCRILTGEEEVFVELKHLCAGWCDLMISYVYYSNPTVSPYDIHLHASEFIQVCSSSQDQEDLEAVDSILLSVLRYDVPLLLNECCRNFSSWWFPVHLMDLLELCGIEAEEDAEDQERMREQLVVTYAEELAKHRSYWQVAAFYLAHSGKGASGLLGNFLSRVPIDCEKKATKVLRLCRDHGLLREEKSIQRRLAVKSLNEGRRGNALAWAVKAKDGELSKCIVDQLLDDLVETGKLECVDIVDYLGCEVLISDKLTFLSKYRQLQRLHEEGEHKQAAILHLNLIASGTASCRFHEFLLLDTLKYLRESEEEDSEVLFDSKQTVLLLSLLNSFEEEQGCKSEEKFHMLRLALNQNLAKSFLN